MSTVILQVQIAGKRDPAAVRRPRRHVDRALPAINIGDHFLFAPFLLPLQHTEFIARNTKLHTHLSRNGQFYVLHGEFSENYFS